MKYFTRFHEGIQAGILVSCEDFFTLCPCCRVSFNLRLTVCCPSLQNWFLGDFP